MPKETIKFTIRQDGTVLEEVSGVKGTQCLDLTESIENQLGDVNNQTFDKIFTIGANPNQNGDYVYIYPQYKWFKGSID